MGTRKRFAVPAWGSLLVIVIGFLAFVGSYFLLPLYVTTLNCFDYCTPPKYATAWESSLRALSLLQMALEITPLLLVLLYLPLLMAVVIVGCGIGFLIHPHRTLAVWSHRVWLVGIIALILLFPFTIWFSRPETGYFGMLAGYALLWGGNRAFLAAQPEARYDP